MEEKDLSNGKESDVGSPAWGNRIRNKTKKAAKAVELGYMELGALLYEVWDTPVDGDPRNGPIYTLWGYRNFADYAEGDLGLERRHAERLRRIHYVLNVELEGMDDKIRKRIVALGVSKVRELQSILTLENAEQWLHAAETNSYATLANMIRRAKEQYALGQIEEKEDSTKASVSARASDESTSVDVEDQDIEDSEEHVIDVPASKPKEVTSDRVMAVPEPEELKFKHFTLYPGQFEQVDAALGRAGELSGSAKPGHNLTMICTDFLATNDFTDKNDYRAICTYLSKMENLLGVRLVAFGKEDLDIVHGAEVLNLLVEGIEVEDDSADGNEAD